MEGAAPDLRGSNKVPEFTEEDAEKLEKLHLDMYFGKDKDNPSVTIRLDRLERFLEQISAIVGRLLLGVVGTMLAVAGEIVLRLLKKL